MVATATFDRRVSRIDGRLDTHSAAVRVLDFHWAEPVDEDVPPTQDYLIDLCPGRRAPMARGCFTGRWSADRYEHIGKIYVVPPGHTLRARCERGRHTAIMCWLSERALLSVSAVEPRWTNAMLAAGLDLASPRIAGVLERLAAEARRPGFASEVLAELLVSELAIELWRCLSGEPNTAKPVGLSARRLRLIDERIAEDGPAPALDELATLCDLSIRQLTRAYRLSRGASICREVASHRIVRAKRLLSQGMHVKTVAFDLGFGSSSAFAFAFRRETGVSPRTYREGAVSMRTAWSSAPV